MDDAASELLSDDGNPLVSVPIEVTVAVGRARPTVRELLRLDKDSVLTLDRRVDDPVELFVGDKLIGLGSLEIVEDGENSRLAVRLTEVVSLKAPL
ncbi:MAG: FliM/FliN family flagellar motor switch protein [Roseivivax sp.]|nr:FliM/FliN family flagellar motor switch protein [Roseivivax sp.]